MPADVRAVTSKDLPAIVEIAALSPEAAQWSRESYLSLLEAGARGWLATEKDVIAGFLLLRVIADEAEILNLAVTPACRRQGIGSSLLEECLRWANQNGVSSIHLEVRASNRAASKFYLARGFRITGLRPGYYSSPPDDAILLARSVVAS